MLEKRHEFEATCFEQRTKRKKLIIILITTDAGVQMHALTLAGSQTAEASFKTFQHRGHFMCGKKKKN